MATSLGVAPRSVLREAWWALALARAAPLEPSCLQATPSVFVCLLRALTNGRPFVHVQGSYVWIDHPALMQAPAMVISVDASAVVARTEDGEVRKMGEPRCIAAIVI